MLHGAYDANAVGFLLEQGDVARARRLSAGQADDPPAKTCTPDELALDAADGRRAGSTDACGVKLWWSSGREDFLLKTAVNGVELQGDLDETRMGDFFRAQELGVNSNMLNSAASAIARLALEYRKVRGPSRAASQAHSGG